MPHPYPPDLTDEQLLDRARSLKAAIGWGPLQYLDEYNRRATDRHTREMLDLTKCIRSLTDQIRWLTWLVVLVAGLTLIVAVAPLLRET